jgi:hypothetical protein
LSFLSPHTSISDKCTVFKSVNLKVTQLLFSSPSLQSGWLDNQHNPVYQKKEKRLGWERGGQVDRGQERQVERRKSLLTFDLPTDKEEKQ